MPEPGFQVTIDPAEWFRLKRDLDKFDPSLARALRRRIKNAGQIAAERVKETLHMPTPEGAGTGFNGRKSLIDATKVSVSFGKRAAGARVVTSSAKLSPEHKGLLNVYNLRDFRHPVFGNRENWVQQEGRPYFGAVIQKALNREIVTEIRSALDDAVHAIGGHGT